MGDSAVPYLLLSSDVLSEMPGVPGPEEFSQHASASWIAIDYDKELYKERHLVECLINKIKHFRRIATRYDKTVCSFIAMLCLCGTMIRLR